MTGLKVTSFIINLWVKKEHYQIEKRHKGCYGGLRTCYQAHFPPFFLLLHSQDKDIVMLISQLRKARYAQLQCHDTNTQLFFKILVLQKKKKKRSACKSLPLSSCMTCFKMMCPQSKEQQPERFSFQQQGT